MPAADPFPEPSRLRYDHPAADELVAALDALADATATARRAATEAAATAREGWSGFTLGWFDAEHAELALGLVRLGRRASDAADAVRRAKLAAATLQQRQDADALLAIARGRAS